MSAREGPITSGPIGAPRASFDHNQSVTGVQHSGREAVKHVERKQSVGKTTAPERDYSEFPRQMPHFQLLIPETLTANASARSSA